MGPVDILRRARHDPYGSPPTCFLCPFLMSLVFAFGQWTLAMCQLNIHRDGNTVMDRVGVWSQDTTGEENFFLTWQPIYMMSRASSATYTLWTKPRHKQEERREHCYKLINRRKQKSLLRYHITHAWSKERTAKMDHRRVLYLYCGGGAGTLPYKSYFFPQYPPSRTVPLAPHNRRVADEPADEAVFTSPAPLPARRRRPGASSS
jgi:hypothetical protein